MLGSKRRIAKLEKSVPELTESQETTGKHLEQLRRRQDGYSATSHNCPYLVPNKLTPHTSGKISSEQCASFSLTGRVDQRPGY